MTIAELRFRFNNKNNTENWITNYIEYLENILLNAAKNFNIDFEFDKLKKEYYQNDYIQYLEFSIVELTRDN